MKKRKSSLKLILLNIAVIVLIVCAMLFLSVYMGLNSLIKEGTYVQGVFVDDTDFSGISYDSAEKILNTKDKKELSEINIELSYNGNKINLNANDLGITKNTDEVLRLATNYSGRFSSLNDIYDSNVNKNNIKNFKSQLIIDRNKIYDSVEKFVSQYEEKPVNAAVSFDKTSKKFSYTEGKMGGTTDIDEITDRIIKNIENNDISPQIQIIAQIVPPDITASDLKENTKLIGSFETETTNNPDRNVNIELMGQAVNGLILEPLQVLSLNDLVGERTLEKGFRKAPAIVDGKRVIDEVGGGICQLAGTLYNAALLADMEILERVRHSFPSVYLPIGQDSTLTWNNKDLKLKNTTEYPIYITAELSDNKVMVELYGQPLPDGMKIEIANDILEVIKPPKPEVIYTSELPAGKRVVEIEERPGYKVNVYRNYYDKSGKLLKSVLVSKDNFPAIKSVVKQGKETEQK